MAAALSKILGPDGRFLPRPAPARQGARASYDAAKTTDDNRRHWSAADHLSAKAANNLGVRRQLRSRSRYERENNGYCGGLVRTLSEDLFGTGPRLQVQTEDEKLNRRVEKAFAQWAEAISLTEKLIVAGQAKVGDGEWFGLLANEQVADEPVHLDVIPVECDQVTTPANGMPKNMAQWVDGMELDIRGRPTFYHVLKEHPGDTFNVALLYSEFERLPVRQVLHWFRASRVGQCRGIPEITPGLPLCSQMRRWTLASLTSAESAADIAILLTTPANPDGDTEDPTPFETIEIERGLQMALPAGVDAKQMAAEHPSQEYGPFKKEILMEMGRPVSAPQNVVTGSSAEYNFSSARMDMLLYRGAMRVNRESCRRATLDRALAAWYEEARLIPGYLSDGGAELPPKLPHGWYWPGFEAVDPLKESLADTERLTNGTTTLQELLAEYGQDWEVFLRQRAKEMKLMEELGLPLPAWMLGGAAGAGQKTQEPGARKAAADDQQPGGPGQSARTLPVLTRRELIAMALAEDERTGGAYLGGHGGGHNGRNGHGGKA